MWLRALSLAPRGVGSVALVVVPPAAARCSQREWLVDLGTGAELARASRCLMGASPMPPPPLPTGGSLSREARRSMDARRGLGTLGSGGSSCMPDCRRSAYCDGSKSLTVRAHVQASHKNQREASRYSVGGSARTKIGDGLSVGKDADGKRARSIHELIESAGDIFMLLRMAAAL